MKNLCLLILSFLLGVFIGGCKDDLKLSPGISPAESQYLNDYKSPVFKWGYIDDSGTETISAIYDDNRDFSNGLAIVNYQGYWGVINKQGEYIVDPSFRTLYSYSEGYALAQNFKEEYSLLDRNGKIVMNLPFAEVHTVHNRRIKVKNQLGYLFLDLSGNKINESVYPHATDFKDGYAVVQNNDLYGLIDTSGSVVIPIEYHSIKHLYKGYFGVKNNSFWNIINLKNNQKLAKEYASIIQNGTHKIAVKNLSGKWNIFDFNEASEIPVSEQYIYAGGEGKWFFREGNLWGVMDEQGIKLTSAKYNALYRYKDDRCVFNVEDFWGYLDSNGTEVIPPVFPLAWDFQNGLARIITSGGIGFMDKSGKMVISPRFIEVRDFFDGMARFQKVR